MSAPPQLLVPVALVGLGLLFFVGGPGSSQIPVPRGLLTGPRQARVHVLLGVPGSPFPVPIDITLNDVIGVFSEFRETLPKTRAWKGKTYLMIQRGELAPEGFWLAESIEEVFRRLGVSNGNFVEIHMPVGITSPRSCQQWEGELEDAPSMELAPLFVNRDAVVQIGPSPIAHYRRRQLGRLYTRDGCYFDLYESLDHLRFLIGPGVPETQGFGR